MMVAVPHTEAVLMLLSGDIRTLKRSESRLSSVVEWVVLVSPIVLLVMANLNFVLASQLGTGVGVSADELVGAIIYGHQMDKCYHGEHVMALEMMRAALLEVLAAVVMGFIAWSYISTQRMNRRILMALKKCQALENPAAPR